MGGSERSKSKESVHLELGVTHAPGGWVHLDLQLEDVSTGGGTHQSCAHLLRVLVQGAHIPRVLVVVQDAVAVGAATLQLPRQQTSATQRHTHTHSSKHGKHHHGRRSGRVSLGLLLSLSLSLTGVDAGPAVCEVGRGKRNRWESNVRRT